MILIKTSPNHKKKNQLGLEKRVQGLRCRLCFQLSRILSVTLEVPPFKLPGIALEAPEHCQSNLGNSWHKVRVLTQVTP